MNLYQSFLSYASTPDLKKQLFLELVIFLFGLISGVLLSLGKGIFDEFFERRRNNRSRAQRIIDKIGGITSKAYGEFAKENVLGSPYEQKSYFEQSADQLDALGYRKASKDIKEFYDLWFELSESMSDYDTPEFLQKVEKQIGVAKKINSYRF